MSRALSFMMIVFAAAPVHAQWARIAAPRAIATGGAYAARFSPDGAELLVSGERLRGLSLVPLTGGSARVVCDDAGAGVDARFDKSGQIAYRATTAGSRRELTFDRSGVVRPTVQVDGPATFARDDRVYLRAPSGERTLRVPATGDRFFQPVLSPDGARVAFTGLATGIYVYEIASGALTHVGAGTAPAWSADGKRLAFERTEDDGHAVVASELYLFEPAGRGLTRVAGDAGLKRRPAFSPDGRSLAFDDDRGTVYVGALEVLR
jgi:Tol biopolymer transport system component